MCIVMSSPADRLLCLFCFVCPLRAFWGRQHLLLLVIYYQWIHRLIWLENNYITVYTPDHAAKSICIESCHIYTYLQIWFWLLAKHGACVPERHMSLLRSIVHLSASSFEKKPLRGLQLDCPSIRHWDIVGTSSYLGPILNPVPFFGFVNPNYTGQWTWLFCRA